jgi:BlaI family penicillinase repressor
VGQGDLLWLSLHATVRNVTVSNSRPLTDLQKAVLDFLWSGGPATSDQVREALHERHPLKDSSVRTILRRLEARGYLRHELVGQSFVYHSTLPPQSLAARAVRTIIDRFCSGSVEQFLLGMVDEKILSPKQLERLAQKLRKPQ